MSQYPPDTPIARVGSLMPITDDQCSYAGLSALRGLRAMSPTWADIKALIGALSARVDDLGTNGVKGADEVVEYLDRAFDAMDALIWPSADEDEEWRRQEDLRRDHAERCR